MEELYYKKDKQLQYIVRLLTVISANFTVQPQKIP